MNQVDAVLVAGDVYESSAPSAQAQHLVVQTLLRLRQAGAEVIVIAGNHDHGPTFEAYRPLMGVAGITLAGAVRPPDKGGVIRFRARSDGADVQLAVLPFLTQRYAVRAAEIVAQTPSENVRAYDEMIRQVVASLTSGFSDATVNLLMSHLTCVGGVFGGGERSAQSIFEYSVPATIFPVSAHYVALGHLHRRQSLPAHCRSTTAARRSRWTSVSRTTPVSYAWSRRGPRFRPASPTSPSRPDGACGPSAGHYPSSKRRLPPSGMTTCGCGCASRRARGCATIPSRSCRTPWRCASTRPSPGRPAQSGPRQPMRHGARDSCSPITARQNGSRTRGWPPCSGSYTTRPPLQVTPTDRKGSAMRPIALDMDGFASFRERTRVDFSDADFFALVGPTGSGKSTIIDAMTFALFGSVPRWGRKGMVSLALAPTISRGTVKLVFEVADQRYVVARELRRMGSQVSQRAASLERLTDPRGLAQPGDPTDVLAKDLSGVNDAVERMLGLSYEDFCQCVVLPQGQFANFLHAKASERQEILLRLLGAEHYRQMMVRANQRANVAGQRAEAIAETLTTLADATPEAEEAARAAETALAALGQRVEAVLPQIRAGQEELSAAEDRLRQLETEQSFPGGSVRTGGGRWPGRGPGGQPGCSREAPGRGEAALRRPTGFHGRH